MKAWAPAPGHTGEAARPPWNSAPAPSSQLLSSPPALRPRVSVLVLVPHHHHLHQVGLLPSEPGTCRRASVAKGHPERPMAGPDNALGSRGGE